MLRAIESIIFEHAKILIQRYPDLASFVDLPAPVPHVSPRMSEVCTHAKSLAEDALAGDMHAFCSAHTDAPDSVKLGRRKHFAACSVVTDLV